MHKPEFRIGRLVLDPHRQLLDNGEPVAIGRRALDLLSVLASAEGALVTKDELVQQVWTGAFVEDNAIQAQIVAARKALGSEADRLTTVRGIGYCLAAQPSQASAGRPRSEVSTAATAIRGPPSTADRARRPAAGLVVIVALVVLVVAIAATVAWRRLQRPAFDTVSLEPFDTAGQGVAARTLAANLGYEVRAALSGAGVDLADPQPRGAGRSALVLAGAAELDGANLHVTARLQTAAGRTLLWSTTFTRPAKEAAAMQEQVANKLADVLHCALDTTRYPGGRVEPATMRLYLRACDLEHELRTADQVRAIYEQIVQREPKFASAWSRLAYVSATSAFDMPPDQAAAARARSRQAAEIALKLNPHDGLAYEALADNGLGRLRFDQLYDLFARGLAAEPAKPEILEDEGELLLRMGQVDEALGELLRASALEPWSPDQQWALVQARLDVGQVDAARSLAERSLRLWPDDARLTTQRFLLQARYGDIGMARRIIADPQRGFGLSESQKDVFTALLTMREKPAAGTSRELVRRVLAAYQNRQLDFEETALDLAQAGALDDVYRLAAARPPASWKVTSSDPEFLWEPAALPLRRDPRFITLLNRIGITDFWRRTGKSPDFCSAPAWPYDCKAVAAKPAPLVAVAASVAGA